MEPSTVVLISLGFLAFIVLLIAVNSESSKEKQRYPDLKNHVVLFSHACGDIIWTENKREHRIVLCPGKSMKSPSLQKAVKKCVDKTPINTKIRITNYVWDLVGTLQEFDLLKENWEPAAAYVFCNGVCMVRYMEKPPEKGKASTAKKDLYFSTADGHLIYLKK